MSNQKFIPFQDESTSLSMKELTIENRTDRVSVYGSIDLTLDQEGLELARKLKGIIDATVAQLESRELPKKITTTGVTKVESPF